MLSTMPDPSGLRSSASGSSPGTNSSLDTLDLADAQLVECLDQTHETELAIPKARLGLAAHVAQQRGRKHHADHRRDVALLTLPRVHAGRARVANGNLLEHRRARGRGRVARLDGHGWRWLAHVLLLGFTRPD